MADSSERPVTVFDVDNTLAGTAHRQHFLQRAPRDWDGFFAAAPFDLPLAEGVAMARTAARTCDIVYLTGRPERCRQDTLDWLARHQLPDGELHMRPERDRRPARATKLETLRRLARRREVLAVVDDDELVCDAAEGAGFAVVRARWAETSPALEDAQEREGRT